MRPRLHPYLHKLPPGPGSFSLQMGRLLFKVNQNPIGELMKLYHRYGPAFTINGLGMEMVFLIGPEANQYMLVTHSRDFLWRPGFFGELIPFVGDGLLTTDDIEHDRARKLLLPVFYPARIRSYADGMVKRARERVEKLLPNTILEIHEWTRELALMIAADLLFGMDFDERLAHFFGHHFEEGLKFYGKDFFSVLVLRGPGTPFAAMRRHVKKIDSLLYPQIKERRRRGSNGDNILDLLLNSEVDGERLSDREVHDHVMTLLFAGHDTTSATIAWMFSLLGQHPYVYRRLVAEIDHDLAGRAATADDLIDGLPYLDRVIKETLRLFPAAWFGPRVAAKSFNMYGHHIPKGTNVTYSSWLTHRLPHLWPDPDAFDPERFLPEKEKNIEPGAYIPFGRGPRLCIGMKFGELEIKAITVALLQRFHLELFPGQTFIARTVPTISPKYGVKLYVRPRSDAPKTMPNHQAPVTLQNSGAGRCPVAH